MTAFWIGAEFGFGLCFAIILTDCIRDGFKYLINKFLKGGEK